MFVKELDWNDPRFEKWNLDHLGPLNKAQQAAFFEDDASYSFHTQKIILCSEQIRNCFFLQFFIRYRTLIFPILARRN